jgi:hypothetical protein
MDEVSVSTPALIRSRGRPRIYASSVEQTAAMRERLRARGLVLAWVRLDVLDASRAKDKKVADKQSAKNAKVAI